MSTPTDSDPVARAKRDEGEAFRNYLEKHADVLDAIQRTFPVMSSLPKPLQVDPDVITDFTVSAAYKQAVEDYVAGRSEQNLLVTVLRLLRGLIPNLFGEI